MDKQAFLARQESFLVTRLWLWSLTKSVWSAIGSDQQTWKRHFHFCSPWRISLGLFEERDLSAWRMDQTGCLVDSMFQDLWCSCSAIGCLASQRLNCLPEMYLRYSTQNTRSQIDSFEDSHHQFRTEKDYRDQLLANWLLSYSATCQASVALNMDTSDQQFVL